MFPIDDLLLMFPIDDLLMFSICAASYRVIRVSCNAFFYTYNRYVSIDYNPRIQFYIS